MDLNQWISACAGMTEDEMKSWENISEGRIWRKKINDEFWAFVQATKKVMGKQRYNYSFNIAPVKGSKELSISLKSNDGDLMLFDTPEQAAVAFQGTFNALQRIMIEEKTNMEV